MDTVNIPAYYQLKFTHLTQFKAGTANTKLSVGNTYLNSLPAVFCDPLVIFNYYLTAPYQLQQRDPGSKVSDRIEIPYKFLKQFLPTHDSAPSFTKHMKKRG